MTLAVAKLVLGAVLLFGGGEILIRGAVSLATRWGVSPLLVGGTVVAFGTSAPELAVCLNAALTDHAPLAMGNIVGSNLANVLLILGMSALVFPVHWRPRELRRDAAVLAVASLAFAGIAATGTIHALWGMLMVGALLGITAFAYSHERSNGGLESLELLAREAQEIAPSLPHIGRAIAGTGAGLVAVIVGADQLVEGASGLARAAGISEAAIGLTLVAIGTSLPELATAMLAAYRRHSDLALGNVIGSNLFNQLGIAGTTALVTPLAVPPEILRMDLWLMTGLMMAFSAVLVLAHRLGRVPAIAMLAVYAAWILWRF